MVVSSACHTTGVCSVSPKRLRATAETRVVGDVRDLPGGEHAEQVVGVESREQRDHVVEKAVHRAAVVESHVQTVAEERLRQTPASVHSGEGAQTGFG